MLATLQPTAEQCAVCQKAKKDDCVDAEYKNELDFITPGPGQVLLQDVLINVVDLNTNKLETGLD